MKTCKVCGETFNEEDYDGIVVNEGRVNEHHVCDGCAPSECNNGHIVSCEACGDYFSAEMLHDEQINGRSFTACPACGKDMVDCLTRDELIEGSKSTHGTAKGMRVHILSCAMDPSVIYGVFSSGERLHKAMTTLSVARGADMADEAFFSVTERTVDHIVDM